MREKGLLRVSLFFVLMMIVNIAVGYIVIMYGFKGVNEIIVIVCVLFVYVIGEVFRMI